MANKFYLNWALSNLNSKNKMVQKIDNSNFKNDHIILFFCCLFYDDLIFITISLILSLRKLKSVVLKFEVPIDAYVIV